MKDSVLSKRNKKVYLALGLIIFVFISIGLISLFKKSSYSAILDNDVEVQPNTQLTYYLNVSYDGVDKNGVKSNSSTLSEISSGYLYVEDKLPPGLIFSGFVTTDDGSIGAVKRSDGSSCPGKIIDDTNDESNDEGTWNEDHTEYTYHGLHYNAETRIVSFTIKNLKAGCELTAGIKTITPSVDDPNTPEREIRRDFYNFATVKEKDLIVNSNTVHAFMGSEVLSLYDVSYEYVGTVPDKAPPVPLSSKYAAGSSVGVLSTIFLEGYTFSGWTSEDITISNGMFIMPEKNIVLRGSFTQNETFKYNVIYRLEGDNPPGYVLPSTKSYSPNTIVNVDSLKVGDVINGYKFLGWESPDVTISSENDFTMPSKDVVITGRFEEIKYKVSYQFYDTLLPPDSDSYLPATKAYKPGEKVLVSNLTNIPDGYVFSGWYKEDSFIMPEEDIIIYGEWSIITKTIEPTITKEIIDKKTYYQPGDLVRYKMVVTNTSDVLFNSVFIKENNDNAYFIEGEDYEVASSHYVRITDMQAGSSITIYAEYKVTGDDKGTIENEVQITGVSTTGNYELNPDGDYTAHDEFKVKSSIKICKNVTKLNNSDDKFQVHVKSNSYDSWMVLGNDECGVMYVEPDNYTITEIVGQDYKLTKVNGAITSNGESLNVELGQNYEITFTNKYQRYGFFHSWGRAENKISDAFDIVRRGN